MLRSEILLKARDSATTENWLQGHFLSGDHDGQGCMGGLIWLASGLNYFDMRKVMSHAMDSFDHPYWLMKPNTFPSISTFFDLTTRYNANYQAAMQLVADVLGVYSTSAIARWNDDPDRTVDEVRACLDAAYHIALEKETVPAAVNALVLAESPIFAHA